MVVMAQIWPDMTPEMTRDAFAGAPDNVFCPQRSGESWFTVLKPDQSIIPSLRGQRVVLCLKPGEFCLQVTDALLETAHFRDHTRVRTADVAE